MSSRTVEVSFGDRLSYLLALELQVVQVFLEGLTRRPDAVEEVDLAAGAAQHQVAKRRHDVVGPHVGPSVEQRLPALAFGSFLRPGADGRLEVPDNRPEATPRWAPQVDRPHDRPVETAPPGRDAEPAFRGALPVRVEPQ